MDDSKEPKYQKLCFLNIQLKLLASNSFIYNNERENILKTLRYLLMHHRFNDNPNVKLANKVFVSINQRRRNCTKTKYQKDMND